MCQRIFCCAKNKHISNDLNEMRPELYPIEWDDYPNQETEANDKILNTQGNIPALMDQTRDEANLSHQVIAISPLVDRLNEGIQETNNTARFNFG